MARNTVKLKKYLDIINEWPASAAITPGMLIELLSTGKVQAHSVGSGNVTPVMFALEDELQGKGIADAYALNDVVQCWVCVPGEEINALLLDGESVVIGDKLASAGNGYLKKHDTDSAVSEEIVAIALEAVDRSTSSGGDTNVTGRIRVMAV